MSKSITKRIAELKEYAHLDGERCNESSIADCLAFPEEIAGMDGPYLFEDGGNMRTLWRGDQQRFGINFYGEGKARLIILFPNLRKKSETFYFDLTGLPSRLTPESFLAFVKIRLRRGRHLV
jgi:hypothetical protein